MARSHLKVYMDFEERAAALNDEEKGRLLLAMHRYARDGQEPKLEGNERFVWPIFKMMVDRDIEAYESTVEKGKLGGRPKKAKDKEKNLKKPDETQNNLTKPEETKKEEIKKEEKGKKKEERRETKKEPPSCEGESEGAAAGFEDFWYIYPRKQGRQDARAAWDNLAPDEALIARMQAAIQAQRQSDQWTREGGRYIPLPATWLSGRRWEDEAGPASAVAKPKTVSEQQYTQRAYTEEQLLAVSDDLLEEARRYKSASL